MLPPEQKMANTDVDVIDIYRRLIDSLLAKAEQVKPGKEIEPPLTETQLGESFWLIHGEDAPLVKQLSQQTQFAAVEIAFREKFYGLLVFLPFSTPILPPESATDSTFIPGLYNDRRLRVCLYMEFTGHNICFFRQWFVFASQSIERPSNAI